MLILVVVILGYEARAQFGNSPYSSIGLGLPIRKGLVQQNGMGGAGLAYNNELMLNLLNPAANVRNQVTSFDAGFGVELKDVSSAEKTSQLTSGSLSYLALGFPIIRQHWFTTVTVEPVTNVDYSLVGEAPINGFPGGVSVFSKEGQGGVTKVKLANSVAIFDNLSVALGFSYFFGVINDETTITLNTDTLQRNSPAIYLNSLSFNDIAFSGSLLYSLNLENDRAINVGLSFEPQAAISSSRELTLRPQAPTPERKVDTVSSINGDVILPRQVGLGLSFSKKYSYVVAADVTMASWSDYRGIDGSPNSDLQDNLSLALGGEWIPDASSVNNYFKRAAYRTGFRYGQIPFQLEGTDINEWGMSLGFSFPLNNFSNMNFSMEYGQRGTTRNELVQENFFRLYLGFSYSDQWFIRRRYN